LGIPLDVLPGIRHILAGSRDRVARAEQRGGTKKRDKCEGQYSDFIAHMDYLRLLSNRII
jgi:hypothetical protein